MSPHPRKKNHCAKNAFPMCIYIYIDVCFLSMCIQIYLYIYIYQNKTLLASPFLYTTNCPGLLRGSRRLPGLWLPAVLLVNLLVDPATTKKIKTGGTQSATF